MKIRIFMFLVFSLFLFGCASENDELMDSEMLETTLEKQNKKSKTVEVPFRTNLSVWDESDYSDDRCGGYPNLYLTMKGFGNVSHLGKSKVEFYFCCNVLTGAYENTEITFVAANGDKLFAVIPTGQIVPNTGPNVDGYYQTKFIDKMYFVGGTGRFDEARGEAWTNAYVHDGLDEWRTDFFSRGTLILKKK